MEPKPERKSVMTVRMRNGTVIPLTPKSPGTVATEGTERSNRKSPQKASENKEKNKTPKKKKKIAGPIAKPYISKCGEVVNFPTSYTYTPGNHDVKHVVALQTVLAHYNITFGTSPNSTLAPDQVLRYLCWKHLNQAMDRSQQRQD